MKYDKHKSTTSTNQSKINTSRENPLHQHEYISFFRRLLESLSRIDVGNNRICTCQSFNRNSNAFTSDSDSQQQLYPHIRKVYNDDTDLLEHVHIIMSTIKPEYAIDEQEEESIAQRRRRHVRVSKQRAKVLITEYCSRKITDSVKVPINKRHHSSLCFSLVEKRWKRSNQRIAVAKGGTRPSYELF